MPVIRPARIEDLPAMARVHVDTWRTSYVGIVPDEHLANLSYERCEARWNEHLGDPRGVCVFVAQAASGQIVGLASGGPPHEPLAGYDAQLYVLYVFQAFQGQGYGKRLVAAVARGLMNSGYRSLVIWVLKENPARHFYERLGGQVIAEKVVEIGGKALLDVAYGWPDLAQIGMEAG